MKIEVPYNRKMISVEVAPEHLGAVLEMKEPVRNPNRKPTDIVNEAVKDSLDEFLTLPGDLLVIVNDGTRPTPTRLVLDAIGEKLKKAKATFIIATGGHRAPLRNEYDFIFGSWYDVFKDRILVHDARKPEDMEYYGTTSRQTEVYFNKALSKAGKVIVIGSVEPHYFAGYTGGRKAFLPGIAAYSTIEHNHKMALSPEAKSLALEGNPLHEDLMEAADMVKAPVYSIMTVLDRNDEMDTVTAGDLKTSFNDAVKAANDLFALPLKNKADVVVSSPVYPMDIDLYQSQKAIENGKLALKDGGTLILVSACWDGIGPDAFVKLMSSASTPDEVFEKIEAGYKLGYHKAAKLAEILRWATVEAYTGLEDKKLEEIFIKPVHDLQKAIDDAIAKYGPESKVVFLIQGSVTVPVVG